MRSQLSTHSRARCGKIGGGVVERADAVAVEHELRRAVRQKGVRGGISSDEAFQVRGETGALMERFRGAEKQGLTRSQHAEVCGRGAAGKAGARAAGSVAVLLVAIKKCDAQKKGSCNRRWLLLSGRLVSGNLVSDSVAGRITAQSVSVLSVEVWKT
eukprot:355176-Chlamydomonas_euryale.AAC.3